MATWRLSTGRKPRSLEGKHVYARFEASEFPGDCKRCIKPQKEGFETPEEVQRGIEDYSRQVARHLFDGFQFIQRRRVEDRAQKEAELELDPAA